MEDTEAQKILEQMVEQDKKDTKNAFWSGTQAIVVVSVLILAAPYIAGFFNINLWWVPWLYPLILPLTVFAVLYLIWSKYDIHCFFLGEGYCVSLEVGGKVTAILMRKTGYCFGPNWEVVRETQDWKEHPDYNLWNPTRFHIQGLYILFNPFEYVRHSPRIWWKVVDKKPVRRIKIIKRVSLNRYPFYERVDDAEDIGKNPIDNEVMVDGMITNPFTVMYGVNDWLNFKSEYTASSMGNYFKTKTIDEIIEDPRPIGNQIYDFMKGPLSADPKDTVCEDNTMAFLKRAKIVLGFQISQILNLSFEGGDKETKEAMNRRAIALLKLEAEKVNADIEAYQSFGPFWKNLSIATGSNIEDLQKEYTKNPEEFNKKHAVVLRMAFTLTREKMEMNSGALRRLIIDGIEGSGDSGDPSKAILALAAERLADGSVSASRKGKNKSKKDAEEDEEECPYR